MSGLLSVIMQPTGGARITTAINHQLKLAVLINELLQQPVAKLNYRSIDLDL